MSSGPPAYEIHPELVRARKLMGRCRLRAARRSCARAIEDEPDNFRARALKARLDAATGHSSTDQAQSAIAELIAAHPNDAHLKVASAVLLAQDGNRQSAIAALRPIAADNPSDSYVHQVLAGFLGCDIATWDDAWVHYKVALEHGSLLSPAYRAAAFHFAKQKEPSLVERVFADTDSVERAAIRTRDLGFNRMILLLGVLALPSIVVNAVTGELALAVAVAIMTMATAWAGWAAFTNYVIGCWKCSTVWVMMISGLWFLLIFERSSSGREGVVIFGILGLIWAASALSQLQRQRSNPPPRPVAKTE
jgi:hypothetical protein